MASSKKLKLMTWNVAGYSGPTTERQLGELLRLSPDVVALQEVVRGSLDFWRDRLLANDYSVLTSAPELLEVEGPFLPHKGHRMGRRKNLNLIAARHAVALLPGLALDKPSEGFPEKYLCARVNLDGTPVDIHSIHTPPGSTTKMLKVAYWEAVLERVDQPTDSARILCGDFNSPWSEDESGFVTGGGRRDPEEEARWKRAELGFLEHPELRDVYRAHHRTGEPYATSHLRAGDTPCRYDHVYVSGEFEIDDCRCEYLEDLLHEGLGDHAPVTATLTLS
jgi:endonuclease/exonuclease/phosphatase family metal-dependent hydrolase